jgi:hypothetical protein
MRQRFSPPLLVALVACAFAAAAQQPTPATAPATDPASLDFEQARFAAGQDEAKLDGDQVAELSQMQADVMKPLIARCTRGVRSRDLTPVGLVLQLDAQGRVARTWQDVHTPVADCLAAAVLGKTVYVPPKVPFMTMSDLHWAH